MTGEASAVVWPDEVVEAVRAVGREHRPKAVRFSPDALVCACGVESANPDGLEAHRAALILAALAPYAVPRRDVDAMLDRARAEGAHQALYDASRDCPLDDVSQIIDFLADRCREAAERAGGAS